MISAAQYAKIKSISYKCLIYSLLLFLLGVAQTTLFSKINILNAPPDILLASVVALSMKENHKICSICAIVSGFFYCALGGMRPPLYILFSFLCGYVFWIIAQQSFNNGYRSFLALSVLAFAAKGIFNIIYSSVYSNRFLLFRDIANIVIPEFISSMLFCSLSYIIFSGLFTLVNKISNKGRNTSK